MTTNEEKKELLRKKIRMLKAKHEIKKPQEVSEDYLAVAGEIIENFFDPLTAEIWDDLQW